MHYIKTCTLLNIKEKQWEQCIFKTEMNFNTENEANILQHLQVKQSTYI